MVSKATKIYYSLRQCSAIVASKSLNMAMDGSTDHPLLLVILQRSLIVLISLELPLYFSLFALPTLAKDLF